MIKIALGEEKARRRRLLDEGRHGPCLGASGAIEAITSMLAVQRNVCAADDQL